jgi:hypothetical protein
MSHQGCMSFRCLLAAGVAFAALGCSTTSTSGPAQVASSGCGQLGNTSQIAATQIDQVYATREVQEERSQARAIQTRQTVGADLYVHATPGTTGEYLERVLTCHAAAGQAVSSNDPFHPSVGHVAAVNVRKAGTGFAVRVQGSDTASAKEIWRRAEALTDGRGRVEVEQLANAERWQSTF